MLAVAMAALWLGGCAASGGDDAVAAESKLEGAPAGDVADTSCGIVLRDAGRRAGEQGPVAIEDGQFVWDVTVDLAASLVDANATAKLHVQGDAGGWDDLDGAKVSGAKDGYQRFSFTFRQLSPESSSIDIAGAVAFIPFAELPGGARRYDHNAIAGNYVLSRDNRFRLAPDVCR